MENVAAKNMLEDRREAHHSYPFRTLVRLPANSSAEETEK
jgi:hypothetical protein